jgi:hypothetical protein
MVGVSVMVGEGVMVGVSVAVGEGVMVGVFVGVGVSVGVGVGVANKAVTLWQAPRSIASPAATITPVAKRIWRWLFMAAAF